MHAVQAQPLGQHLSMPECEQVCSIGGSCRVSAGVTASRKTEMGLTQLRGDGYSRHTVWPLTDWVLQSWQQRSQMPHLARW